MITWLRNLRDRIRCALGMQPIRGAAASGNPAVTYAPTIKNPARQDPPWLQRMLADMEAGVAEIPGTPTHPRIAQYHSYAPGDGTSDEIPWCSSAGCAWMEESGIRSPRTRRARGWIGWGRSLRTPVRGCIAILRRGNDGVSGHWTIFMGYGDSGRFRGGGGNQGNKVGVSTFLVSDVLAWLWPTSYPLPQ